jgi:hypothetical protein
VAPIAPPPQETTYQPVKPALPVEPMRRGRPVKPTTTPQPVPTESDPFVKLGSSATITQFEFTPAPGDDDIASRFPSIEELSGGVFTSAPSIRSRSQPPVESTPPVEDVDALADDAFALPIQPYHRKKEVDALADDVFKSDVRSSSAAARIRAAIEREKDQTEWVEPIQNPPSSNDDDERVIKPSEVLARGGVYVTQPQPSYSTSTPLTTTNPPATTERNNTARSIGLRRKAEESRRIIDESRKMLEEQWPNTNEPISEKPSMVSIGIMTSPPPSPPTKPKEIRKLPSFNALPPSKTTPTEPLPSGLSSQHFSMQETEVRPVRSKTPVPSPVKPIPYKDHARPESPQPRSGGKYSAELTPSSLGKGLPKQRPRSLYLNNDLDFLRSYDGKQASPLEKSHTGLSTASQPASLPSTSSELHFAEPEQDLEYLHIKDEERKARKSAEIHRESPKDRRFSGRRASSGSSVQKHFRQTSLGAISKGIMSGKFADAFRKFEGLSHHDLKFNESRFRAEKALAKASPEAEVVQDENKEDWKVETHDIPVTMRQHLNDTRKISTERDSRPTIIARDTQITDSLPVRPVSGKSTSSKAKSMIQQRMNEYLNAQTKEKPPPLTADGYGPYISVARTLRNPVDTQDEE